MNADTHNYWPQKEALALCAELERFAPSCGCHVALTGGLLYKTGLRKNCDIVLYRIRQAAAIDYERFFTAIQSIGVFKISSFGFCHKGIAHGKLIDFLSPEEEGDEYPVVDPADKLTTDDLLTL